MNSRTLLVECTDRRGLVHEITGVLFGRDANVMVNLEFVDRTHEAKDHRCAGRDVEQNVLERALCPVLEDRVFLCRNRGVIFKQA